MVNDIIARGMAATALDESQKSVKPDNNNNFTASQIFEKDVTIQGNLKVQGTTIHNEELKVKDVLIYTRDGATEALQDDEVTGFESIKYDGEHNGQLVFDKTGTARVGDVEDTQPLLTREEAKNLNDGDVLIWDEINLKAQGAGKKIGKNSINDNAEIFNDYVNNESNIPMAHIAGNNNKAIIKGYLITGVDSATASITLDSVADLAIGDNILMYRVVDGVINKFRDRITKITNNTITLELNSEDGGNIAQAVQQGEIEPAPAVDYSLSIEAGYWIIVFKVINGETIGTHTLNFDNIDKFSTTIFGTDNIAGICATSEGRGNVAMGTASHAEGWYNIVYGERGHVEGYKNKVYGHECHVEGSNNTVTGYNAHAEGVYNTVKGSASHGEGVWNVVNGNQAHAEGGSGGANGYASHSEGKGCYADSDYQHVQGKYNKRDNKGRYAHILGNGENSSDDSKRSNAHTIDWNGNGWFAGELKVGSRKYKLVEETVFNTVQERTQRNTDYILSLKQQQGLCLIEGLDGTGTEEDPVLIGSEVDWERFVTALNADATLYANGKHYKLIADLDFSNYVWTGTPAHVNGFSAHFDGDGHTIFNYTVGNGICGLFYQTFTGSIIEKLGMVDTTFTGVDNVWYGAIVGRNKSGTIRNCYIYGIKDGGSNSATYGGIVGQVFWSNMTEGCDIEYCYAVTKYGDNGYIDNTSRFGGLIGTIAPNTQSKIIIAASYTDVATLASANVSGTTYTTITLSFCIGNNSTSGTTTTVGMSTTKEVIEQYGVDILGGFGHYVDDIEDINSGYPILTTQL